MNDENKPPMFGPSAVIDLAGWEPRAGKSAFMSQVIAELSTKPSSLADTIMRNCSTSIPLKTAN